MRCVRGSVRVPSACGVRGEGVAACVRVSPRRLSGRTPGCQGGVGAPPACTSDPVSLDAVWGLFFWGGEPAGECACARHDVRAAHTHGSVPALALCPPRGRRPSGGGCWGVVGYVRGVWGCRDASPGCVGFQGCTCEVPPGTPGPHPLPPQDVEAAMRLPLAFTVLLLASARALADEMGAPDDLSYWADWADGEQAKVSPDGTYGHLGGTELALCVCVHAVGLSAGATPWGLWVQGPR